MRITFNQLRIFTTVVHQGSFSRAAEALHLTQPTLSVQVKQLADQIGAPLLEQIGKRVHPTAAGREVLVAAEDIARALERLESALAAQRGLERGHLRLAVVSTAEYFVPRLLGTFHARHPGIDVALQVVNRQQVIERLRENADDLYVMTRPPAGEDIEHRPVVANPLVVIAPRAHPLASKSRVRLADLAAHPFVLRERGSGTRLVMEEFFARHSVRLDARLELGSNEAIKQAVSGGLGLSVISALALKRRSRAEGLAVLPVEGFPIPAQWHVVRLRGKQLSAAARAFLVHLEAAAPALEATLSAQVPMGRVRVPRRDV